jgi:hypothetical protein
MSVPEDLKIVLAAGEEFSNKRISLNFTSLSHTFKYPFQVFRT